MMEQGRINRCVATSCHLFIACT